jgi:cytochrome c biogenesis protein CcdA
VLLQGDEEIGARLASVLADAVGTAPAAAATSPAPPASPHGAPASALALLPVLAGGLLDGVNPCAFTTLVFLIASLAAAGRDRRQVLLIGVMFTLAVFATYFAVGLGLLSALRAAVAFPLVARIIRWLLVAVLAVLATLSARDAVLAARGREGDMALQLPDALKRRIRASIRSRVGSTALAATALGLGFVVSVFEFACTGQVYLPTLAYLARSGDARAVPLLAAYNVAFIAPLVAVFAASWAGVTSYRLGAFLQRHLVAVKAALAVFFAALAALTLAT